VTAALTADSTCVASATSNRFGGILFNNGFNSRSFLYLLLQRASSVAAATGSFFSSTAGSAGIASSVFSSIKASFNSRLGIHLLFDNRLRAAASSVLSYTTASSIAASTEAALAAGSVTAFFSGLPSIFSWATAQLSAERFPPVVPFSFDAPSLGA